MTYFEYMERRAGGLRAATASASAPQDKVPWVPPALSAVVVEWEGENIIMHIAEVEGGK